MKTLEQKNTERIERLSTSVNVASKLRVLVDDHDVRTCLDGIEKQLIEDLIKATTSDARDRIAAEVKAWRKVRSAIAALAHGGEHSATKLASMTGNNTNGY